MRRDYFVRLLIVLCFLLSLSALIGAAALFPAYLSARNLEQSEQGTVSEINSSKEAQNRAAIDAKLRSDQAVVTRLLGNANNYRASGAVQTIVGERGAVTLTSFAFTALGTSTAIAVLQGQALTRDELLAFKARLLTAFPQSTVDLPLSELAKQKDIEFSMKITYKTR